MQSELAIASGHDEARLRAFEVDKTPIDVAVQVLAAACELLADPVETFLDPSAGAGAFGRAVSQLYPDAHVTSVEPREEELLELAGVSDELHGCRFEDVASELAETRRRFDLIGTNPPFSLWPAIWQLAIPLLKPDGLLVFYGPSNWGHSDEPSEAGEVFDTHAPCMQLRVMGRVKHRRGLNPKSGKKWGTDSKKYSGWCWRRTPELGGVWITKNLPRLSAGAREWRPTCS